MSETQAAEFNPYLAENMPEGGGLTRDAIITSAKYVMDPMKYRDGSPVIDKNTKQPSFFVGLRLTAIRVGEEGKEDKYEYSSGKKSRPSADGEMLLGEDGKIAKISKKSNLGRFTEALGVGGFDRATLFPKVSVLVGAKITFAGFDQKKADGTVKTYTGTDGKPHNSLEWYPEKYNGGAGSRAAVGGTAATSDLTKKAQDAVVAAVAQAGGSIERKDVFRSIAGILKGDVDAVKVSALVARQDFELPAEVVADGSTLKLAGV